MPGAFTHLVLLDQVRQSGGFDTEIERLFAGHPNYTAWGAIGPDYLFFYPPDWDTAGAVFRFILEVQDTLKEVFELFETIEEAKTKVGDFLTGGLWSQINMLGDSLIATLNTQLAIVVAQKVDFFEYATPPMHQSYRAHQIPEWWWIDVAHHHRTGDFARALWRRASSAQQRAYCLGYLTHVAGDVVGHPFVNAIVGGPYRNHWRRHVMVEKCLDTWVWKQIAHGRISNSKAYRRIQFNSSGDFPSDLSSLIAGALQDTYASFAMQTGVPSAEDINHMYTMFLRWMRGSSELGSLNVPPPDEDFDWFTIDDRLKDVIERLNSPPTIGNPVGNPLDPNTWKAFFIALFQSIRYLAELLIAVARIPLAIFQDMANMSLRFAIWMMLKVTYELYDSLRLALATAGYVHPEPEQVDRYFRAFVRREDYGDNGFPWMRYHNSLQTYHLVYPGKQPGAQVEQPYIYPEFWTKPHGWLDPLDVLFGNANAPGVGGLLNICGVSASGSVSQISDYLHQNEFTSARVASIQLIEAFLKDGGQGVPNWNLDGDRGFGWPSWRTSQIQPSWDDRSFSFSCT